MGTLFTINQPGGAGSGGLGNELLNVRAGVEVQFNAAAAASYAWDFAKTPYSENPAITNPTSQNATCTFPAVAGRYQLRLLTPAGGEIRIVEVSRDVDGELLTYGLVPMSEDEQKGMSPVSAKGAASADERRTLALIAAIAGAGGGGGAGTVTEVTASAPISVANGTTTPTLSIADAAIALAKLANIAALRVLGSIAGGAPAELTPTQVTASLVEDATTSLPGRLSAAFWNLLNGATSAATALALARRDASGDLAVRRLTVTDQLNATGALEVGAAGGIFIRPTTGGTASPIDFECAPGAVPGTNDAGAFRGYLGANVGSSIAQGFQLWAGPRSSPTYELVRFINIADNFNIAAKRPLVVAADTGGHDATFRGASAAWITATAGAVTATAGTTVNLLPAGRVVNMGPSSSELRIVEAFVARQSTTSTSAAIPTGFSFTPGAEGGTYELTLRAEIGTDHASWVWALDAAGATATFTAGAVPVSAFESTPALAGFQATLEESGGATIACRVQPDTASSVTWSLTVRRIR